MEITLLKVHASAQFLFLIPLRVFDSDSELRFQSSEQRALKAEEALQAALEKIQDLERQLQGRPSLEPESIEGKQHSFNDF